MFLLTIFCLFLEYQPFVKMIFNNFSLLAHLVLELWDVKVLALFFLHWSSSWPKISGWVIYQVVHNKTLWVLNWKYFLSSIEWYHFQNPWINIHLNVCLCFKGIRLSNKTNLENFLQKRHWDVWHVVNQECLVDPKQSKLIY